MTNATLPIFIGYDSRQPVAFTALVQSIIARSSKPVAIVPLVLDSLPIERAGLTPFTYTRFLVPHLMGFKGPALFLDIDMLVLGDIAELFALFDPLKAVQVVKTKERFEWASLILFNCGDPKNRVLTPDYVEKAANLHMLPWLGEELIGGLPAEWNHCVFYDAPRDDAKLVHFTAGIPMHPETQGCEYTAEWMQDAQRACATQNWTSLMAQSVHAARVHAFQKFKMAQRGANGYPSVP